MYAARMNCWALRPARLESVWSFSVQHDVSGLLLDMHPRHNGSLAVQAAF